MKKGKRLVSLILIVSVICTMLQQATLTVMAYEAMNGNSATNMTDAYAINASNGLTPFKTVTWGGHIYQAYDDPLDYDEAAAYCSSIGGHLATITSAEEQGIMAELLTEGKRDQYYLGATDVAQEGNWKWCTGEPWGYTNWHSFEPGGGTKENYLSVWRILSRSDRFEWNDTIGANCYPYIDNQGFICEIDEICPVEKVGKVIFNENVSGIYVYNFLTGEPVANARVTLMGGLSQGGSFSTTIMTNQEGVVEVPMNLRENATGIVEINHSVHGSFEDQNFTMRAGEIYPIYLIPTASEPTVFSVKMTYRNDSVNASDELKTVNILTKAVVLTEEYPDTFSLTVKGLYNKEETSSNNIKEYQLIQGKNVIARCSGESGIFSDLKCSDFVVTEEKEIFIRAVGNDGTNGKRQLLHLYIDKKPGDGDIKIEDKVKVSIPEDIPLIGGDELSIGIGNLPVAVRKLDDGKYYIGVNVSQTLLEDKNSWQDLKNSVNKQEIKKDYFKTLIGHKNFNSLFEDKNSSMIWGYLEGDKKELTGKLAVLFKAKTGHQYSFPVGPVPVVALLDIKGELKSEMDLKLRVDDSTKTSLFSDLKIAGCIDPSIEIVAGAGLGWANIVNGTLDVSGKVKVPIDYSSVGDINTRIILETSLRATLRLLFIEYSKTLASGQRILYDSDHALLDSVKETSENDWNIDLMDMEDYSLVDRSYLDTQSPWMGNNLSLDLMSTDGQNTKTITELQHSIYVDARPKMVRLGNDAMLIYLADDPLRQDADRTTLVYSFYQSETGVWSEPQAICNDGTADFFPEVYCVGDQIYVTWTNFKQAITPDFTEQQNTEICMSVYNPKDGFQTQVVSEGSFLNIMPQISYSDEHIVMTWIHNKNGNIMCNDGGNQLHIVKVQLKDGDIIKKNDIAIDLYTGMILDSVVGNLSGLTYAAYIVDTDNDYSTTNDRILQLIDEEGNIVYERDNIDQNIWNPMFTQFNEEEIFTWAEDGVIYYINDIQAEKECLIPADKCKVTDSYIILDGVDRSLVVTCDGTVAAGNGAREIYAYVYIKDAMEWGEKVQLTDLGQTISEISGYLDIQDNLKLLFLNGVLDEQGHDIKSLSLLDAEPTVDLGIKLVDKSNIYLNNAGEREVMLEVEIANHGDCPVENFTVILKNGNAEIKTAEFHEKLLPGQMKSVKCHFTFPPNTNKEQTYKLGVESNNTDVDLSNNEISVILGFTNAIVRASLTMSESGAFVTGSITNNSLYNISGKVYLYDGMGDDELYSERIDEIRPDETCNILYKMDSDLLHFTGNSKILRCEFVSDTLDFFEVDNTDYVVLYNTEVRQDSLEVVIAESGQTGEFTIVNGTDSSIDADLIAAFYTKEGRMQEAISQKVLLEAGQEINTIIYDESADFTYMKLFILDSDTKKPLVSAYNRILSK